MFLNNERQSRDYGEFLVDDKTFVFNLESYGRLPNPMKFEIKKDSFYDEKWLVGNSTYPRDYVLFDFGDICIKSILDKCNCCCFNNNYFDYKGMEFPICGKRRYYSKDHSVRFTLEKLIIFEME